MNAAALEVSDLCAPFGTTWAKQRRYYANLPLRAEPRRHVDAFCDWLLREGQDTERSIDQWARGMGW